MNKRGRPRSFDRATALQQAMMTFWAHGYDNTALSDLTAAMGLNPPSLYAAFGSKENLFREAVTLYCSTEGSHIWSALQTAPTAREAIATLLHASAEAFTRPDKPRGCLVILGALFTNSSNAAVHQELQHYRSENITRIIQRLQQSVTAGELSSGTDLPAVATYFATLQQGMSILARDGASRETVQGVVSSAMAAWDSVIGAATLGKCNPAALS